MNKLVRGTGQSLLTLWRIFRAPLVGLLLSLGVGMLFLMIGGERPMVLWEGLRTTCFTSFGIGYTLFYATPLIFTGLSVAVCFHCGLFNIGAEGQLYVGSLFVIFVAYLFPSLPAPVAIPLAIVAAALGGAIWGGLAGWLKAARGSHEVIVTILLNFVGINLVNYFIMYPFKSTGSQNPETFDIPENLRIWQLQDLFQKFGSDWLKSTPVNVSLFVALGCAFLCYILLFYTTYGYGLRTVGLSPLAARFAGISVPLNSVAALFLAGGLSGLVGVNEIMGHQHRLVEGFSPGYGFTGIAVALLARNHPLGIVLSAFLFGALHNSARELEFLSEKVTKELSLILQGTLIAFVAADFLIEKLFKRKVTNG